MNMRSLGLVLGITAVTLLPSPIEAQQRQWRPQYQQQRPPAFQNPHVWRPQQRHCTRQCVLSQRTQHAGYTCMRVEVVCR